MDGVTRIGAEGLSPAELADLEAAIGDPERFHGDGRAIGVFAIVLSLFLAVPLVVLVLQISDSMRSGTQPGLEVLGVIAMVVAQIAVWARWLTTRGRHGYAVCTFGVVRVRGHELAVLRYEDLEKVVERDRRRPRRIITAELELRARDGSSLVLYGWGVSRIRARIEAQRSAADSSRSPG